MSQDDRIDLNNLTQKELLILLHNRMNSVERDLAAKSKIDLNLQLRVKALEVKMVLYAFIGGGVVSGLFNLAKYLL